MRASFGVQVTESSGFGEEEDSCSELQYLDTFCSSAALVVQQSLVDSVRKILSQYETCEWFHRCQWLEENNATQYIKNLFGCT